MRNQLAFLIAKTGGACRRVAAYIDTSPAQVQANRVKPFFAARGDKTLRLNYDLDPNSIVLDLGGYEGQWASDIFAMYLCRVHVFEPVEAFATNIRNRFRKNPNISVHSFGLASDTRTVKFSLGADGTSQFTAASDSVEVKLVRASDFFAEQQLARVDLMKINIEGGEYDLLEHLIDSGLVSRIANIQVQFHDCVDDADRRMRAIRDKLCKTHSTTYQFDFVWENWRLHEPPRG